MKIFWYSVSVVFIITALLMLNQYLYLRKQANVLIAMQNDYSEYLAKLNAIIEDFQKSTDTNEECAEEKKKDSFVAVNRSPEYLSSSLVAYLQENNMTSELARLRRLNYIPRATVSKGRRSRGRVRSRNSKINFDKNNLDIPMQIAQEINFAWPLEFKSFWISSYFGPRKKANGSPGFHYGLDLAAVRGTIVRAAASGKVIEAGYATGYGNTIVIEHTPKYKTRYAHLHSIKVKLGAIVEQGQRIGTVGNTGLVRSSWGGDASHLHFEVVVGSRKINPLWVLPKIG